MISKIMDSISCCGSAQTENEEDIQFSLKPKMRLQNFASASCAQRFSIMINELPDLDEFIKNKYFQNFMKAWNHRWFGGSILMPVASDGH